MVLATKSKSINNFSKFICVFLSLLLMAGTFVCGFRVVSAAYYTGKVDNILGHTENSDISSCEPLKDNVASDINCLRQKTLLNDDKAIVDAINAQKERYLNSGVKQYEEELSDIKSSQKSDSEDGEETTALNIGNVFDFSYEFNYKDGIQIRLSLSEMNDNNIPLNEIYFSSDNYESCREKLSQALDLFIKYKLYKNSNYIDNVEPENLLNDLKYYVVNDKNNIVVTNFPKTTDIKSVLEQTFAFTIVDGKISYSSELNGFLDSYNDNVSGKINLGGNGVDYYFYYDKSIPDKEVGKHSFRAIYNEYQKVSKYNITLYIILGIIMFVLSFGLAIFYFIKCGTKLENGKVKRAFIDYVPTDVHFAATLGLIALISVGLTAVLEEIDSFSSFKLIEDSLYCAAAVSLVAVIWGLSIEFISSLIRVCRSEKKLHENLLVFLAGKYVIVKPAVWSYKKIKVLFEYKPDNFKHRFTRYLILYGVINLILFIIAAATKNPIPDLFIVAFNAAIVGFGVWYSVQLDKIITAAHTKTVLKVDYNKLPNSLKVLCNSINYNRQELETAVAKAVRDERMRSELITNVSHDLKTPLTSIITYVDLLKNCEIEDENANEYIEILDEKSNRLKRLIEDLIEASKITSGVVNVNPVNISLTELAAQAVFEKQSEFESNNLELVFKKSAKNISCYADGNKTYRILENLLSNASKYSLKGSRVYCSVYETQNFSVFEIKNTSAQSLDITPEELKERFVRGDKSRTNEGNGLGLSIADNLCRIQGGNLHITIDGDLFKVQVMLPKSK